MVEVLEFGAQASFVIATLAMLVGFAGIFWEDRPGDPAWQEAAWTTMYWGWGVALACFLLSKGV
jgi:hypothetical protein